MSLFFTLYYLIAGLVIPYVLAVGNTVGFLWNVSRRVLGIRGNDDD